MRWITTLLLLLSTFVPLAQAQVRFEATLDEAIDAANENFAGDHVVVLSDSSQAFRDFESNMLQDPEVWKYLNDNFAAFRTDAGSQEAGMVRVKYPTLVKGMLLIIAAPRLNNLTIYIGPSCPLLTKDILMRDLKAVREATTPAEAVQAMKQPSNAVLQPPAPREGNR